MRKQKLYEIREINAKTKKEKRITLGDNYAFKIYSIWKGEELNTYIEDIIKVDLPIDEEEALDLLKGGFTYEEEKYIPLATTTGMMKHENIEEDYSCEYFFIKEEDKDFKVELTDLASLGKLKTKEGIKLCINKDVVSRLSLLFSVGERVSLPNLKVAILPEMTYKFANNYLQFKEVDKNIDLDKFELEEKPNQEVEHIAFDGSGLIMPNVMEDIQKQLELDYPLDWIGFREVGVASKGLLVKMDFKQYFKEEHGLDRLVVLDMFGDEVDLMKVDVIMNETQVKWAKWFKSMEEIQELKSSEKYKKYADILNGFTITKYNKEKVKEYTEANYQILSNLAITPKKLDQLSIESEHIYGQVIKGSVPHTKIMLGDLAREDREELSASTKMHQLLQLDESLIHMQSMYKIVGSLVNKKINNLAGGGLYLKGNYKVVIKDVVSYLDSLINPDYIYKDGKLKGIVGSIRQNGLKPHTNYVPGETGNRVLARCPLNSATELIKTTLVKNKLYDKYFEDFTKEIIFYSFDDTMMLQSGEDEDTDISFVIDEPIIYDAVIEDIDPNGVRWFFRNQFDGGKAEAIYNEENLYKAILKGRGNKIGELANKGAIISNIIQEMPYKRLDNNKCISYDRLIKNTKNKYKNHEKSYVDAKVKEKKDLLIECLEEGKVVNYTDIQEKEIKDFIKKNFQRYKIYSYYLLFCQMLCIDSPKTGLDLTKEHELPLKAITKGKRKPRYIYYAKYKQENQVVRYKDCSWSNTLLNNYAKRIISTYGAKARSIEKTKYSNDKLRATLVKNNNAELNTELVEKIQELANAYYDAIAEIKGTINGKEILLKPYIDKLKETRWNKDKRIYELDSKYRLTLKEREERERLKEEIEELNTCLNVACVPYKASLEEIDILTLDKYNTHIKAKYGYKEILKAIYNAKTEHKSWGKNSNISSKFITSFCYEELKRHLLKLCDGIGTVYEKTFDKKDDAIKYLYNYYILKKILIEKIDRTNLENYKLKFKNGEVNKLMVGGYKGILVTDELMVKEEKWKDKVNINLYRLADNLLIGYLYPNQDFILMDGDIVNVEFTEVLKGGKSVALYCTKPTKCSGENSPQVEKNNG
ncbi:hypothetical protein POG14_04670 [Clostridium paraputrificum]|uniref:hypothetical protein n=1 Tax=Clostridium paraputrificum TaxID=29363 RepID=UPI0018986E7C|nr:hypothetical protein [Clostridium paraputrificum]MDC0801468.1 hypothetical protein [Clostridium paraputrificum]